MLCTAFPFFLAYVPSLLADLDGGEVSFLKGVTIINMMLWTPYLLKEILHKRNPSATVTELEKLRADVDKMRETHDKHVDELYRMVRTNMADMNVSLQKILHDIGVLQGAVNQGGKR